MADKFDIKLPIKDDLKKGLIFGLGARTTIAEILSMCGYRHEVLPLMQNLSHGARSYIHNANGLPGFVFKLRIIDILYDADDRG